MTLGQQEGKDWGLKTIGLPAWLGGKEKTFHRPAALPGSGQRSWSSLARPGLRVWAQAASTSEENGCSHVQCMQMGLCESIWVSILQLSSVNAIEGS